MSVPTVSFRSVANVQSEEMRFAQMLQQKARVKLDFAYRLTNRTKEKPPKRRLIILNLMFADQTWLCPPATDGIANSETTTPKKSGPAVVFIGSLSAKSLR